MRKKPGKISLSLPRELIRELDAEVSRARKARPGTVVSRSEIVREILVHFTSTAKEERRSAKDEPRTYESLVKEAFQLKERGNVAMSEGGHRRARKMFLQSAAKELEALALVEDMDSRRVEEVTKTALIEVVVLLKMATGYNYLPDVPSQPRIKTVSEDQSD
jgi:metal-responsive CopG/Arc/MetJ family transcriptional regulator